MDPHPDVWRPTPLQHSVLVIAGEGEGVGMIGNRHGQRELGTRMARERGQLNVMAARLTRRLSGGRQAAQWHRIGVNLLSLHVRVSLTNCSCSVPRIRSAASANHSGNAPSAPRRLTAPSHANRSLSVGATNRRQAAPASQARGKHIRFFAGSGRPVRSAPPRL